MRRFLAVLCTTAAVLCPAEALGQSALELRQLELNQRIALEEKRAAAIRGEVLQLQAQLEVQARCSAWQQCQARTARINAGVMASLAECNMRTANWYACDATRSRKQSESTTLGCLLGWGIAAATGGSAASAVAIGCGAGAIAGDDKGACKNQPRPLPCGQMQKMFERQQLVAEGLDVMPVCGLMPSECTLERSLEQGEQALARIDAIYDLTELDIALMRGMAFDLIQRGYWAAWNWDAAARSYQRASVFYGRASAEFAQATQAYQVAGDAYRTVAITLIGAANSELLLRGLCGRPVSTQQYREVLHRIGVNLDGKDIDHIIPRSRGGPNMSWNYNPLDAGINRSLQANGMWWKLKSYPLETLNALASYAAYMLVCKPMG